jgi:glycosyltransferase involved in cell wall biosynthesis
MAGPTLGPRRRRSFVDDRRDMAASRRSLARLVPDGARPILRELRGLAWRGADEAHAVAWRSRHRSGAGRGTDVRRDVRGRVLVIDHTSPDPSRDAGSTYMLAIMRLLRDARYAVTFLPSSGPVPAASVAALGDAGVEVSDASTVLDWLLERGRGVSHAIVARPDVAMRQLPRIRRWSDARVLYYTHDLHGLREQRRYEATGARDALAASRRYRAIEASVFGMADVVLTPSEAEVPVIRSMAPGADVRVVVPAVELPEEDPMASWDPAGRRTLLFVGSFTHAPNVDAALSLVREVMPRVWERLPDAAVRIVGQEPPPPVVALAGPRVDVVGHVPDLAPYWREARASVSPLRYGAGVKGKVLSSLASGVPVVTTTIGNEGIDLVDGRDAVIADTPDAIAAGIVALLTDDELARSIARHGSGVVRDRFSTVAARGALLAALGEST